MSFRSSLVAPVVGLVLGAGIGYVDSRPTWDDAGITAGALFLCAGVLSMMAPRSGWLVGLAVGLPVLLFNVVLHANYGSAAAVVVALVGAGVGSFVGRSLGVGDARPTASH
jgi:hypothetical protein